MISWSTVYTVHRTVHNVSFICKKILTYINDIKKWQVTVLHAEQIILLKMNNMAYYCTTFADIIIDKEQNKS